MTDTTNCGCGSPDAEAMAPNERLVHRTDGPCFIERTVDGLPGFRPWTAAATREHTLDEILTELRRIGDGIDKLVAGTRQAAKSRPAEVARSSKRATR